jgi:HD-GYP domain-containing protein (c-di-GMP phosphodiesterase class II)
MVLFGSAAACLWRAASRPDGRWSWLLIGLGLGAWALGDIAFWTVGSGAISIASQVMYVLLYVGALGGVGLLMRGSRWDLSATLDLAVALLGVTCLWSWLVLGQVLGLEKGVVLYPMLDLAISAAALVLLARSARLDFSWLLLLAGFGLIGVADSNWAVQTARGTYIDGGGVDALYSAGALLVGVAAWTNVRVRLGIKAPRNDVSLGLASLAAIAALVVLIRDHFERVDVITLVLAGVTLLAVVGRWLLAHRAQIAAERRTGEEGRRIVTGLLAAVNARDHRTQDHAERVSAYASGIATQFEFTDAHIDRLQLAAKFHDIGKLAVPERILGKIGKLTPEEFEEVKPHCAIGEEILCKSGLTDVGEWVRSHQERWDGAGYPDGLAGEGIPLESRILAGADSLDAMTADRPYRTALTPGEAGDEARRCAGTQFDPRVAEAMIAIIDAGLVSPPAS